MIIDSKLAQEIEKILLETDNVMITHLTEMLSESTSCLDKICSQNNIDLKSIVSKELFMWIQTYNLVRISESKKIRNDALSKLTKEERNALGFK